MNYSRVLYTLNPGKGVNGEQVIIYRSYVAGKKFSDKWNEVLKQFIAYMFEKSSADQQNVTLITDFTHMRGDQINTEIFIFFCH